MATSVKPQLKKTAKPKLKTPKSNITHSQSLIPEKVNINYLSARLPSKVWVVSLLFGVFFAIIYAITASQAAIPYGDSNEFLAVANDLGVARPSGYPVYVVLLHFFMNLPVPATAAFRGILLSVISHGTVLSLFFILLWRLVAFIQENSRNKREILSKKLDGYLLSSIGVITLGGSFLFWLYGSVTERYAFNDLLLAGMLILISFIITTKTTQRHQWWWDALWGLYGLALINQPAFVIFVPMLICLIYQERKMISIRSAISGVLCFTIPIALSLMLLFFLNHRQVPVSWHFEPSIRGLWNHISLPGYINAINVHSMISAFPQYLSTVADHFGWLVIILFIFGLFSLKSLPKRLAILLLLGVAMATTIFPLSIGWPDNFSLVAGNMGQYLLGYIFIPLFVVLGAWLALVRIRKIVDLLSEKQQLAKGIIGLLVIIPLSLHLISTWQKVQFKSFTFYPRLMTGILKDLPTGSMLACFSGSECFTLLYLQQAEHIREDVVLVTAGYPINNQLSASDGLHGFNYNQEPFKSFDYVTWNIGKRRVYAINLPDSYLNIYGMKYGFMYFIPHGYYGELTREVPQELPQTDYLFTKELLKQPVPAIDLMRLGTKVAVARMHILNARMYQNMGLRDRAHEELNLAANLMFQVPQISQAEIENTRTGIEYGSPYENYKPGSKTQPVEEILKASDSLLEKGRINQAYDGALGAVTVDPASEAGRLKLAAIYEKKKNNEYALIEYQNVLKYYPENQEALRKIAELEGK